MRSYVCIFTISGGVKVWVSTSTGLVSIRPAIEMNGQIRTAFVVNCLLDFDEIWLKVIPGSYKPCTLPGREKWNCAPFFGWGNSALPASWRPRLAISYVILTALLTDILHLH